MTASTAWRDLQTALTTTTPACRGDARFIADDPGDDADELAEICDDCPVLDLCHDYARQMRTGGISGYWAGRVRGRSRPRA